MSHDIDSRFPLDQDYSLLHHAEFSDSIDQHIVEGSSEDSSLEPHHHEHGHFTHVHDSRDVREHQLLQHGHDVHSKDAEKQEITEKVGLHDEHSDPVVEHPYEEHPEMVDHQWVDHDTVDHRMVEHGVPRKHFRYHPYDKREIEHFRRPYSPSRDVYDREEMGREIAQSHWVPPHFFDQVLVQENDHIG